MVKNTLTIELQLTHTNITFCYGRKAYRNYIKENFNEDCKIEWSGCSTELSNKEKYEIVIGVRKYKDIYALKGLIVHEISHCVSQWMDYYDLNCDEVRSYTLQNLYMEIIVFLDTMLENNDTNSNT